MNKTIIIIMLCLIVPIVLGDVGDTYSFSNHIGQLKQDNLFISAYLTGEGCFFNFNGGATYSNYNCNSNDLAVSIKIYPDVYYDGELINKYEDDGINYFSSRFDDNCESDTFKTSCVYPYRYFVWVSDNDIFNLDDIMRHSRVEFSKANDYLYYVWSGDYPYATLAIYDNIVYNDVIEDSYDLEHLEAVRYGFNKGDTGSKVCSSNVVYCMNNKADCFINPNDVILNSQSCSYNPASKDDFSSFDNLFYSINLNYWSYPFIIRSIIVTTTTTDGSEYHNGYVDPKGLYLAPSHRYDYVSNDIPVLSDSFVPSESPLQKYPTGFDSIMNVPLDTNKYEVADIDNVKVEIDFYMNDDYRHKSPLDKTAHFNDIFSGSYDSGDLAKDSKALRYTITLNNIVSETINESGNDIYNNVSAEITTSVDVVDQEDINYNDFDGGFSSDNYEDEIGILTRTAKVYYSVDQESDFFSNMYGVAIMFFGVFLMVFTLLSAIIYFAVIGFLFFGLWSGMIKAIDTMFKWW